jgi:hypothetical protein
MFGLTACRRGVMPYWLASVLVLGSLATVFLTPVFIVPGISWLVSALQPYYSVRASRMRRSWIVS